jgi:hypothetical protein
MYQAADVIDPDCRVGTSKSVQPRCRASTDVPHAPRHQGAAGCRPPRHALDNAKLTHWDAERPSTTVRVQGRLSRTAQYEPTRRSVSKTSERFYRLTPATKFPTTYRRTQPKTGLIDFTARKDYSKYPPEIDVRYEEEPDRAEEAKSEAICRTPT